jgi:hypothetical protein
MVEVQAFSAKAVRDRGCHLNLRTFCHASALPNNSSVQRPARANTLLVKLTNATAFESLMVHFD